MRSTCPGGGADFGGQPFSRTDVRSRCENGRSCAHTELAASVSDKGNSRKPGFPASGQTCKCRVASTRCEYPVQRHLAWSGNSTCDAGGQEHQGELVSEEDVWYLHREDRHQHVHHRQDRGDAGDQPARPDRARPEAQHGAASNIPIPVMLPAASAEMMPRSASTWR